MRKLAIKTRADQSGSWLISWPKFGAGMLSRRISSEPAWESMVSRG